ncbi:hypothetical protein NHQ30_001532 [Ciborinia camelliae]|nr:hypothetical protein NHQ30_001532 [Ciborinia camelliae]
MIKASNTLHEWRRDLQINGNIPFDVNACETRGEWEKDNDRCVSWISVVAESQILPVEPAEDSEELKALEEYRSEIAAKSKVLSTTVLSRSDKQVVSSKNIQENSQITKEGKNERASNGPGVLRASEESAAFSKYASENSPAPKGKETAETSYTGILSRAERSAEPSKYIEENVQIITERKNQETGKQETGKQETRMSWAEVASASKSARPAAETSSAPNLKNSQAHKGKNTWRPFKVGEPTAGSSQHSVKNSQVPKKKAEGPSTKILSRSDKPMEPAASSSKQTQDNSPVPKEAKYKEELGEPKEAAEESSKYIPPFRRWEWFR